MYTTRFIVCFFAILAFCPLVLGECGNAIKEGVEGCDDGNFYNRDGCNSNCELEVSTFGVPWYCVEDGALKTDCCVELRNPLDDSKVCDCQSVVAAAGSGVFISTDCQLRDEDECNTNNGGCHTNGVCLNQNATVGYPNGPHSRCECPTGWRGDGVTTCDINSYVTTFSIRSTVELDITVQKLYDWGIVPASVASSTITITKIP